MKKKLLFEEYLIAAFLLIMLIIIGANVLGRYVFHFPIAFTEELVVYLFACASIIGAPAACARGANMGLSALTDLMPKNFRTVFLIISATASIVLFSILFYQGIGDVLMVIKYDQKTPILRIPEWVFGISYPIGSGLYIFRVIQYTINEIKEMNKK